MHDPLTPDRRRELAVKFLGFAIEDLVEDHIGIGEMLHDHLPYDEDSGDLLLSEAEFDGEIVAMEALLREATVSAAWPDDTVAELRPVVVIDYPDDDHVTVSVNGTVIATANYDEHGRSGMDAVERTAVAITRALGDRLASEEA